MTKATELSHFYEILERLAAKNRGPRVLSECHGRMPWPRRGVYYFFEPGEERSSSGVGPRVVRVGTHAVSRGSRATLWKRLALHRGTSSGSGNHRGSIFRLLVGEALLRRDNRELPSWGLGSTRGDAARRLETTPDALKQLEAELERTVSEVITAMPLLWLEIDDEPGPDSMRAFIERNSIALLAGAANDKLDAASSAWLGRFSKRQTVRDCGLWNQDHVRASYDAAFLEKLSELVDGL